jgi:MoaA/NifB/PqqE/SkfB family radical SAM enzyme
MSDIKTFEKKWNTKVFIRHSRTYLHNKGMSDAAIDRVKNLSPFNRIVEDELKLNQLIVTVTNHCNHACGFCYYHENLNLANNDLTLDEYQKISESIGNLNVLWITGGEPFLQKNLSEICKIFVTNNNVAQIFIPTNGSLPDRIEEYTEKILDQNPDVRLTLMFSLEGTEDLHDAIHNRKGAFLQVKESIKRINFLRVKFLKKGRIFSILLNTVVSSKNVHNIGELMEFTRKNLMIDAHSLSPMRGQGQDPLCLPPTGDEMKAIYKQAKFYFEFYTKKSKLTQEHTDAYLAWMERRYSIWSNVLNGAGLPFDCMAGELIGVLEPDGGLRVCGISPGC